MQQHKNNDIMLLYCTFENEQCMLHAAIHKRLYSYYTVMMIIMQHYFSYCHNIYNNA